MDVDGGRPRLPVPKQSLRLYGLCGRKATFEEEWCGLTLNHNITARRPRLEGVSLLSVMTGSMRI